jgi:ribose transport system permease protein
MTVAGPGSAALRGIDVARAVRVMLPAVMLVLVACFAAASPTFRSGGNLVHVLINDVTLPALTALGMTLVVSTGGIDLSVGTAADLAALAAALTVTHGGDALLALAAGLAAALCVGVVNAILVAGFGIAPFLATLGILFIGESVQQLATNGGAPIYVVSNLPPLLDRLAHGAMLSIPIPLIVLAVLSALTRLLLARTAYGRRAHATGIAPSVARHSGVPVRRVLAITYILSASLCGTAGLLLLATVKSYVPLSGNAFLLDAIGAVFLGTTISGDARPNVPGTLLGVLLFGVLRNGLLLVGWNFYWQQIAVGLLVLLVLGVSFGVRRRGRE